MVISLQAFSSSCLACSSGLDMSSGLETPFLFFIFLFHWLKHLPSGGTTLETSSYLTNLRVLKQILNPCRLAGFRILPLLFYFWFFFYPGLRLIYIIADSSHTSCCGCSEEVVSRFNVDFKYAAQTPGLFSSFRLSSNGTKIKKKKK